MAKLFILENPVFISGSGVNMDPSNPPSLDLNMSKPEQENSQLLRDLIMKKKQLWFGRLSSLDSDAEDVASVAASDTGSLTTNPAFVRGGRGYLSIRSAMSDNEMDDSVSISQGNIFLIIDQCSSLQLPSPLNNSEIWSVKSSLSSGYRYRSGTIMSTVTTPSPDTGRYYMFEVWFNFES